MTVRFYSSIAQQTTLTGTYSPSSTVIAVAGTTGFPSSTPFTLSLDYGAPNEELVDVTAVAGLSLTVTRAVDGTSATTHNAGAVVRHVSSARDFAESRAHENASTNVHGIQVGSSVVGTTDTQTLTNKTLTTPTFNNPNITGTVTGGATYAAPTFSGLTTVSGNMDINGTSPGVAQFDITGASGQTASLQRWISFAGTTLATVNSAGNFLLPNGVNITTTNTLQVPMFIKGPASMASPYIDIQDNTSASLVNVANSGKLNVNKGALLIGDPSPSTNPVNIQAGAANNNIVVFNDSSGATVASINTTGKATFDDLSVLTGSSWIAFTPLWTSTGTAPAIGNGTLAGRLTQLGKTVTVTWHVKFGTTTTLGTGTWGFSYPSGMQPYQGGPTDITYTGAVRGHTTTPSSWYTATAAYDKGTDSFRLYSNGATTEWSPTAPVAWPLNANSYFEFTVTYETV